MGFYGKTNANIMVFFGKIFTGHLDALPWTDSWEIHGLWTSNRNAEMSLFVQTSNLFAQKSKKKTEGFPVLMSDKAFLNSGIRWWHSVEFGATGLNLIFHWDVFTTCHREDGKLGSEKQKHIFTRTLGYI
jgi:hypothetical protein